MSSSFDPETEVGQRSISPWLVQALGNVDDPDKPDYRDENSQEILRAAELPLSLMGGTKLMRDCDTRWLPKNPKEKMDAYRVRLARTMLLNKFREAIRSHSSRIFSDPARPSLEAPPEIIKFCKNVDRCGNNIHSFSKAVYEAAKPVGISYIFVDAPPREEGERYSDSKNLHPYLTLIPQTHFLGHIPEYEGGVEKVVGFRKLEYERVPKGKWGYETQKIVREVLPGKQVVHTQMEEGNADSWVSKEIATDQENILLFPYYTGKTGYMQAYPSMEDLAYLNLTHWQSYSDQRNILHYSRVPLLFIRSVSDLPTEMTISTASAIHIKDPQGKCTVEYIEPNGKSMSYGETDLQGLVDQMDIVAAEALKRKTGAATATARALDEVKLQSELQKEAIELRDAVTTSVHAVAHMAGWEADSDPEWGIDINTESAGLYMFSDMRMQVMSEARKNGDISLRTFLERAKQTGLLDRDLDVDLEIKRLQDENNKPIADSTSPPESKETK